MKTFFYQFLQIPRGWGFWLALVALVALPLYGEKEKNAYSELLQMGFQNLHENRPEVAIEKFESVLEKDPDHAMAGYGKAASFFKLRRYDETLSLLNQVLDRHPDDLNTLNLRAITYYNQHQFQEAIDDFLRAASLDSREGYFLECLAWAYLCAGRVAEASNTALQANSLYQRSGEDASFTLLVAYLAFRLDDNPGEALKVLRFASEAMDPIKWPYPVVDYYRGTLDEVGLIVEVDSLPQETEARTYIAIEKLLDGDLETARRHLKWVVKRGVPEVFEHTYAQILLQSLSTP